MIPRTALPALLLGGLAVLGSPPVTIADEALFTRTETATGDSQVETSDRVLARETVRVDPGILAEAPDSLLLELAPGVHERVFLVDFERRPDGLAWRGRFADDDPDHASITLTVHRGLLHGTLKRDGLVHSLRPVEGHRNALVTARAVGIRDCAVGVPPSAKDVTPEAGSEPPSPPRLVYRAPRLEARHAGQLAMFVTIPADFAEEWGGEIYGVAYAQHAVDSLTTAFVNSGIGRRAFLAGSAIWGGGGSPVSASIVQILQGATRSSTLAQLRDEAGADVVAVYAGRNTHGGCGVANLMSAEDFGPQWASETFSVTRVVCDDFQNDTFVHENGHVLGANHIPEYGLPSGAAVFPYAFGYAGDNARTVMAPGTNHHLFSNPLITVNGAPAGVEGRQDNARALAQTLPVVVGFRSGGVPLPPSDPPPPPDEPPPPPDEPPPPPGGPPGTPGTPALGAIGAVEIALVLAEVPDATGYEVEVRSVDPSSDRETAIVLADGVGTISELEPATPYTFRVRAINDDGASSWSDEVSATTLPVEPQGPCVPGPAALCLLEGRFRLSAAWRSPRPPFAHGPALAGSASGSEVTGLFTFFDPDNVELAVKMLDGSGLNGHFWLFYGALSDVEYWITVTDLSSDRSRTYHNRPFQICGLGDTEAFVPGESASADPGSNGGDDTAEPVPLRGPILDPMGTPRATRRSDTSSGDAVPCSVGSETLCLADGRFRVSATWSNPRVEGDSGTGRVFGIEGDQSGHFWFFGPENLELSVKILDGRPINGHHWFYWGGLSDVAYTLRVLDTETGAVHEFRNPAYTLCGGAATDVL